MDIHIIPDSNVDKNYREKKKVVLDVVKPSFQDLIVTISVLIATTGIGILFWKWGFTESNIITIYILGVLIISLFAKSYFCSIFSSLAGVLLFNFFFTEPRLTLHAYEQGYPVTFAIMLTAALITGTLANKLKQHAKQTAQAAFRTKILFDTNQLLQKAKNDEEIRKVFTGESVSFYPGFPAVSTPGFSLCSHRNRIKAFRKTLQKNPRISGVLTYLDYRGLTHPGFS